MIIVLINRLVKEQELQKILRDIKGLKKYLQPILLKKVRMSLLSLNRVMLGIVMVKKLDIK